jgi:hypothetical protein
MINFDLSLIYKEMAEGRVDIREMIALFKRGGIPLEQQARALLPLARARVANIKREMASTSAYSHLDAQYLLDMVRDCPRNLSVLSESYSRIDDILKPLEADEDIRKMAIFSLEDIHQGREMELEHCHEKLFLPRSSEFTAPYIS